MLQPSLRIATFVLASGALAATAAAQAFRGGAPAIHAAPAPAPHFAAPAVPHFAAPAPHFAAPAVPHFAAPAPRIVAPAPRIAPQISVPHVAPQQYARPYSAPSYGAITRHAQSPRIFERSLERRGSGPGSPEAGSQANVQRVPGTPTDRLGHNAAPQNQAAQKQQQNWRLTADGRGNVTRALRNPFLANRSGAGDPALRKLASATFHGRLFDHDRHDRDRHRHFRPIVIGWVGPLFWPYAYDDFVDYTFYPYAYDTFWPYAYDDVYEGMFGRYAYSTGGAYAAVGRPGAAGSDTRAATELCTGRTAGLTEWPIERIAQAVEPDDAQRATLDELKDATANALDVLKAACPSELPSTPVGRLAAMRARLEAMLQAVRIVRPALEHFYQSLNDEQKARFNALGDEDQQQSQRDLAQACGERASGVSSVPIDEIERVIGPDDAQRAALAELRDATTRAVDLLKSGCPTYRPLTPVVRLEAMEQRLDAMLRAVQTVEPALAKFYNSLSDEQKEQFNRLPPRQA
jgi:hypothetical protein